MSAPDVLVIGAGPAGSACALELARSGAEVVLVHDPRRRGWPGESLPPGSTRVITSILGPILDEARGHRVAAGVRSAWGSSELVEADFIRDPSDDAWVLDRAVFDQDALAVAELSGVRVVQARAGAPVRDGAHWRVPMGDAGSVTARTLVDATGRPAHMARRLGMRTRRRDRLVALVSSGERAAGARTGTLIESTRLGWWYATVIGDRAITALLTDADLLPGPAERLGFWRTALGSTSYIRDAAQTLPGPSVHRADTAVGEPPYGPGWVAVGDAAAAWDPLSSQGLLSGILLAAKAANAIAQGTLRDWGEEVRLLVDDTLTWQAQFYALERRWPDAPFWQRRHDWLAESA